jgi:hypothetical protein
MIASAYCRILVRFAKKPECVGIVRTQAEALFEVDDRLSPLHLRGRQPSAVNQGLGIVGLGGKPAIHFCPFSRSPRRWLDDFAVHSYGPRRGYFAGGVARMKGIGIRRGVPVQSQQGELFTDPPQVPDVKHALLCSGHTVG